jgi:hypothetical protein
VGGWSNEVGGYNITINNVVAQGTDTIMWGSGYECLAEASLNLGLRHPHIDHAHHRCCP